MSDETRLDELLQHWEELQQQGTDVSAAQLCQDCPQLQAELEERIRLLRNMDARFGCGQTTAVEGAALSSPPGAGDGGSAPSPEVAGEAVSTCSHYRLVRFHARGGLGEVVLGHDEDLHRDVALKRIHATHSGLADHRQRFLREAAITSRLEHPGIVPVYGLGHDEDGRPCYAMRFVQGQTLREAIRAFHAVENPDPSAGGRSLAFRQLLTRFVSVCNAVAYAHSQGVVHRDLKPANIMLGPYGESLVVDWGLAKTADADLEADSTAEPTGSSLQTQPGAVMGTPAYMSPEQAGGRSAEVGPASDVYSLGATLYTLLTNHAPVEGGSTAEVLAKVRQGHIAPPRQRDRSIPAALDAICGKAMALRPPDRYATALALAADIEHWLADEPVSAYREPWLTRARRWIGRHRTLVSSVAAAVVVAALILAVAAALLRAAYGRERQAAEEARLARERADAGYRQARQAVDEFYTRVSQNQLLHAAGVQPVRRELLEMALQYYQDFLHERAQDANLRVDVALAHGRIGQIISEIGDKSEAIDWERQAITRWRQLVDEQPQDRSYRRSLAEYLDVLGRIQRRAGRPREAVGPYQEAVGLLVPLCEQGAENDDLYLLSRVYADLAVVHAAQGFREEAIRINEKGIEVRERLLRRAPDHRRAQLENASALNNLAGNQIDLGRLDAGLKTNERSRAILERLVREEEADPSLRKKDMAITDPRNALATNWFNTAFAYDLGGRREQAIDAYEQACRWWEILRREEPDLTLYASYLVQAHNALGVARQTMGHLPEAFQDYDQGRRFAEEVLTRAKKDPITESFLGCCLDGMASCLAQQGKAHEAKRFFEQAAEHHRRATAAAPAAMEMRQNLSWHCYCRAEALLDQGRAQEALPEYERGRALAADLLAKEEKDPFTEAYLALHLDGKARAGMRLGKNDEALRLFADAEKHHRQTIAGAPSATLNLSRHYTYVGEAQFALGHTAEAFRDYDRGRALAVQLLSQAGKDTSAAGPLAVSLDGMARCCARLGKPEEALRHFAEAEVYHRRALEGAPALVEVRKQASRHYRALARFHRDNGRPAEAVAAARKDGELWPADGTELFLVARDLALCIPLMSGGPAQATADEAMNVLRKAVAAGFRDAPKLRSEPDLQPLRDRADFQTLLHDVQRIAPPPGRP